jgi:hypothetical protein
LITIIGAITTVLGGHSTCRRFYVGFIHWRQVAFEAISEHFARTNSGGGSGGGDGIKGLKSECVYFVLLDKVPSSAALLIVQSLRIKSYSFPKYNNGRTDVACLFVCWDWLVWLFVGIGWCGWLGVFCWDWECGSGNGGCLVVGSQAHWMCNCSADGNDFTNQCSQPYNEL